MKDLKKSKRKDYPFYFDEAQANYCFEFAYRFCRHSKGKWSGEPLYLELWQKFIVGSIFGWKRKDNDLRRFKYFYIQVPRKNGKSTLMAFIGLYVLVCDGEDGAEIYSAATKKDQAKIIFDEAKNMVSKSPELSALLSVYRNNISLDSTLSKFEPLASNSDNLDGLNVHCGIIDELHAHKDGSVYDILDTGTSAREQPLIGAVTTAGRNINCYCHELYEFYKQVLATVVDADDVFIFIAEPDEGDDWTSPEVWEKVNPNWGVSIIPDTFVSTFEAAKNIPTKINEFKCKKLDMWVSDTASWINIEKYINAPELIKKEELIGKPCYIGGDLSERNDLTSVVLEFPLDNGYAVLHHSFIPEDKIYDNSKLHKVDYQLWIDKGYITATPGSIVDYDYIENYIISMADKYDIREVCFDPWNATQLMAHLEAQGFTVVETRQGFLTLSQPMKDLQGEIENGRVTHFNDPVLKWAMANVVVTSDENGNIRPNKKKSRFKIDPAAALINAHTRAYTDSENYINVNDIAAAELEEFRRMLGGTI